MRVTVMLALALAVVPGCSLFMEPDQAVVISATDPSATLLVDGRSYGPGSRTVKMVRNQSHVVMAIAGERQGSVQVGYTLSSTGIMDIIGGLIWLGPFVGLATPGAWQIEREHVCVMLPPKPGDPPPPAAAALPGPVASPVVAPAAPAEPRRPLDRRVRDERDYAWPGLGGGE